MDITTGRIDQHAQQNCMRLWLIMQNEVVGNTQVGLSEIFMLVARTLRYNMEVSGKGSKPSCKAPLKLIGSQ